MSADTFASVRVQELPAIFRNADGIAYARGVGAVQDAEMARLRVAALADVPAWCPDDALDGVGGFLRLPRLGGEPNGTAQPRMGYRGRLCAAFAAWALAGSKAAIIASLNAWGLPDVTIVNDYEKSPPWPGSWYTRFEVDVGPSFGTFGWGPGNDPTVDQQKQMVGQILKWKWICSLPVKILLDDGAGYTFTIPIVPIIDDGFIIGNIAPDIIGGTIGGYQRYE